MNDVIIPLAKDFDPQNYHVALTVAREKLAAHCPGQMAQQSGCPYHPTEHYFTVTCLNHPFTISYPAGRVTYQGSELLPPFPLQLIMLNYLSRADGASLTYDYISYRQLDGGQTFYDAFYRTAINPLSIAFGQDPQRLLVVAKRLGGVAVPQTSGYAVLLYLLPRVPLLYQIWPGDEELAAQANILFDHTANHYLHTEDLASCDVVSR
ncbi:MAG: DUF3786 domain-containing protein, partial [Firmicutes bacterium]|nr:DUF3786 domain-containing protein [Bacillota bacterium]